MANRLYILKRLEEASYDEVQGFIVRANSARAARELIYNSPTLRTGDEGRQTWLNSKLTSCRTLKAEGGLPGIVMRDFLNG